MLDMWVIYRHPKDYPANYVARRFRLDQPTADILLAESLESIRELIPPGLYRMERYLNDEPHIVEVWF